MAETRKPTTYRRGAGLKALTRTSRAVGRVRSCLLLDRWPRVKVRLRAAKHIALFLDFDGTLTPIQPHPEDVWLDDATRRRLRRLAGHPRLTVVVISGRMRGDLVKRVRVPGLQYLGLHGQERVGRTPLAGPSFELLRRVRRALTVRLKDLQNLRIEDKRLSFVVHYRGATGSAVQEAQRILQDVLKPLGPALRVLPGKKVWEVSPAGAPGKGAAVADIMKGLPAGTLPIYLGDDTTDESAFAALRKGVTVHVGTLRGSKARYQLCDPAEVKEFMEKLEVEIS